jgi:hypothetical protein
VFYIVSSLAVIIVIITGKLVNPAFAAGYDLSQLSQSSSMMRNDRNANDTISANGSNNSSGGGGGGNNLLQKADKMMAFLRRTASTAIDTSTDDASIGSMDDNVRCFNKHLFIIISIQSTDSQLRVCSRCKQLLERRDAAMELRQSPPILVQMYERLSLLIDELSRLYPSYCRMADSLKCV